MFAFQTAENVGAARATRTVVLLLVGILHAGSIPGSARAQTMPGPVYYSLFDSGAGGVAERLDRQFEPASTPDEDDVDDLLQLWRDATGGPRSDWDWLAVTRLWLLVGDADRADEALQRVGGGVPESFRLLARARLGFLDGDPEAASFWWAACAVATEESALEIWLDLVSLATPDRAGGVGPIPSPGCHAAR